MSLPESQGARTSLLDAIARANDRISLCKFAIAWGNQVVVDVQYLAVHVEAPTLSRLVWLVQTIADKEYPRLLDVARAREALDDIEAAYKRSPAA